MEQSYKITDILNSTLVKNIVKNLLAKKEIEIIQRPASFIIRLKDEPEDRIFRIILLPPNGFTANKIDETTPHPEVRKAKIEIKGGVKPNKSGFNLLKNCIKYQHYSIRNIKITEDELYPKNQKEFFSGHCGSRTNNLAPRKKTGFLRPTGINMQSLSEN